MSKPLRILITAGSTREPIDPVRFIGNRSSGLMGAALVAAAVEGGHEVTLIAGPVTAPFQNVDRIDIETAQQMGDAVLSEFPTHDVLIMAAAIADFRPTRISSTKLARSESITIECEPTVDIVATAANSKRPGQLIVAFSLESAGDSDRARLKMLRKKVDLMVFNELTTMNSKQVAAMILSPSHPDQPLEEMDKLSFARLLLKRITQLAE